MKKIILVLVWIYLWTFTLVHANSDAWGGFWDDVSQNKSGINSSIVQASSSDEIKKALEKDIVFYTRKIQLLERQNASLLMQITTLAENQKNERAKEKVDENQRNKDVRLAMNSLQSRVIQLQASNERLLAGSKMTPWKIFLYVSTGMSELVWELFRAGIGGVLIWIFILLLWMIFVRAVVTILTFPVWFLFKAKGNPKELLRLRKKYRKLQEEKKVLDYDFSQVQKRLVMSENKHAAHRLQKRSQKNIFVENTVGDNEKSTFSSHYQSINTSHKSDNDIQIFWENYEIENPFEDIKKDEKQQEKSVQELASILGKFSKRRQSSSSEKITIWKDLEEASNDWKDIFDKPFGKTKSSVFGTNSITRSDEKKKFSLYSKDKTVLFS